MAAVISVCACIVCASTNLIKIKKLPFDDDSKKSDGDRTPNELLLNNHHDHLCSFSAIISIYISL